MDTSGIHAIPERPAPVETRGFDQRPDPASDIRGVRYESSRSKQACAILPLLPDMKCLLLEQAKAFQQSHARQSIDSIAADAAKEMSAVWRRCLTLGAHSELAAFLTNPECRILVVDGWLGAPVEQEWPDTPLSGYEPACEAAMLGVDALLLGLLHTAGFAPAANCSENDGRLIRNVVAALGKESEPSSYGSDAPLGYHTDQPNYALSASPALAAIPDVLAFVALRNAECVSTDIIVIEDVLDHLSYRTVRLLEDPAFSIIGPPSTAITPFSPRREAQPLLMRTAQGSYSIRFDTNVVDVSVTHPEYAVALSELQAVLLQARPTVSLVSSPGQFLMFKNRYVLHGRSRFARADPSSHSRWLRRVYGVTRRERRQGKSRAPRGQMRGNSVY